MRVRYWSDLHLDYGMEGYRYLLREQGVSSDVLVLAGDIAESKPILATFIGECCEYFRHVFYIPGNHEYWWNTRERDPAVLMDKELSEVEFYCKNFTALHNV